MVEEPEARQRFAASPKDKALLAFREMWANAKFSHLDEHTDFIKMLIDNPDVERLLGEAVFESVYRESRRREGESF